jgi:hypothetical protein
MGNGNRRNGLDHLLIPRDEQMEDKEWAGTSFGAGGTEKARQDGN